MPLAATPTPPPDKRTGVAGGKKTKRRKATEKSRAIIIKPSTNFAEDMAMRARRTSKGPTIPEKLGAEEWYVTHGHFFYSLRHDTGIATSFSTPTWARSVPFMSVAHATMNATGYARSSRSVSW